MWSGTLTRDWNHIPYFGRRILIPWTTMERQPVLFYFQKNPKMKLWIFSLLNSLWPVGRQRGLYIRRKWSKVSSLTSCPLELRDEGITRRAESIHVCHCSGTCKRGCFRKGWACDEGIFHLFNVILYLGTRPLPSRMEVIHGPVAHVLVTWKASPVPIPHHSGGFQGSLQSERRDCSCSFSHLTGSLWTQKGRTPWGGGWWFRVNSLRMEVGVGWTVFTFQDPQRSVFRMRREFGSHQENLKLKESGNILRTGSGACFVEERA